MFLQHFTISVTIATTIFMPWRGKKVVHIENMAIHIPNFIKVVSIVFELSWDALVFATYLLFPLP